MTRLLLLAFRLAVRRAWAEPWAILGQLVLLAALVLSYGVMLKAVPQADLDRLHFTAAGLVWYVVVTETVVGFHSYQFRDLQDEIRSGAIEILLLRPVALWPLKLAEWFGYELGRIVFIAPFAVLLGMILTGGHLPLSPALWLLLPIVALSTLLILSSQFLIGCSAHWVVDSRPCYWLWQKFTFLLGAMLWPLAFYPVWLRDVAWATPYPAILAVPGTMVFAPSWRHAGALLGIQCGWLFLFLLGCVAMSQALRRRVMEVPGR